jgi:hypothetical protein
VSNITYKRGDNEPIHRNVTVGGEAVDVTGWKFTLTVNAEEKPADTTNQLFQVIATLTDASIGSIDFYPTSEQTGDLGSYYFDIEVIDAAGRKSTPESGAFLITQDITKTNPGQTWVPTAAQGAGGADVVMDGSEFWRRVDSQAAGEVDFKYGVRDLIPVMIFSGSVLAAAADCPLWPSGADSLLAMNVGSPGIYEFTILAWSSFGTDPTIAIRVEHPPHAQFSTVVTDVTNAGYDILGPNSYSDSDLDVGGVGHTSPPSGWFWMKSLLDLVNGIVSVRTWDDGEDEPATWDATVAAGALPSMIPNVPRIEILRANIATTFETASFKWERVG